MYVLRYPEEFRAADKYFGTLLEESDRPDMVDVALDLISEMTSPFKPEVYANSYDVALAALIKEKSKGRKIVAPDTAPREKSAGNGVDLMEALKKSVKGDKSWSETAWRILQGAPGEEAQPQKVRLMPAFKCRGSANATGAQ